MTLIEMLTKFFAWSLVINIGILVFSTIMLILMRTRVSRLHAKLFDVDEQFLSQAYFKYLAQYKIMVLVFNLVPYLALKIIGS